MKVQSEFPKFAKISLKGQEQPLRIQFKKKEGDAGYRIFVSRADKFPTVEHHQIKVERNKLLKIQDLGGKTFNEEFAYIGIEVMEPGSVEIVIKFKFGQQKIEEERKKEGETQEPVSILKKILGGGLEDSRGIKGSQWKTLVKELMADQTASHEFSQEIRNIKLAKF